MGNGCAPGISGAAGTPSCSPGRGSGRGVASSGDIGTPPSGMGGGAGSSGHISGGTIGCCVTGSCGSSSGLFSTTEGSVTALLAILQTQSLICSSKDICFFIAESSLSALSTKASIGVLNPSGSACVAPASVPVSGSFSSSFVSGSSVPKTFIASPVALPPVKFG